MQLQYLGKTPLGQATKFKFAEWSTPGSSLTSAFNTSVIISGTNFQQAVLGVNQLIGALGHVLCHNWNMAH